MKVVMISVGDVDIASTEIEANDLEFLIESYKSLLKSIKSLDKDSVSNLLEQKELNIRSVTVAAIATKPDDLLRLSIGGKDIHNFGKASNYMLEDVIKHIHDSFSMDDTAVEIKAKLYNPFTKQYKDVSIFDMEEEHIKDFSKVVQDNYKLYEGKSEDEIQFIKHIEEKETENSILTDIYQTYIKDMSYSIVVFEQDGKDILKFDYVVDDKPILYS